MTLKKDEAKSCYDHIIKDGKMIGEFEKVYQEFDNPWSQADADHVANSPSRNATIIHIRKYGIRSIVEVGCGLGYYTNHIQKETGVKIKGIDISPTAVEKAKRLFPHIEFEVGLAKDIEKYQDYDAVLFSGMLWYVLPELKSIFAKILTKMSEKYFLNNLVFHNAKQTYGKEFFTNIKELIEYVPFPLLAFSESGIVERGVTETSTIFRIQEK
jgi:trans-aconitate methyltransferase